MKRQGTGLGLSTVKRIVETYVRGKDLVESDLGKGSKFTFVLPKGGADKIIERTEGACHFTTQALWDFAW